ncbi:hypothetical protein NW761_013857 [Fusarium oxysporum]|nr:hypothetical protein NW761_013857 [Fusarium oxysporum]
MPTTLGGRFRPLDYALFYSKINCNAPNRWTECNNCTCYVAVQLLLEADCNVIVSYRQTKLLADCSLKARKLFFEHLKDRRERLRNVAFAILPEETLHKYGVAANSFPDKTAIVLWSELQKIKDQQDRRVWLPDSLNPCDDSFSLTRPESLFEFPHRPQVVELALEYALAPKDENGVPTLLSGRYIIPGSLVGWIAESYSMKYLDWLLQHDLNLELSLEPFRFSILHRIAVFIGDRILPSLSQFKPVTMPLLDIPVSELQDSRTLLPVICRSNARCDIPCPCSSGMFSRPLAHILPAMLESPEDISPAYVFRRIGEIIELVVRSIDLLKLSDGSSERSYMTKCAIHILTMISLGVRHLPICLIKCRSKCEEAEWKEILDEDRELIDHLQTLDEEFREAFDCQNVPIGEFLRGYWLTRMKEVIADLNKPLDDDGRYDLWEAGVVLKEDDTDGSECWVEDTEDEI